MRRQSTHIETQNRSMSLALGASRTGESTTALNPRQDWRGFSFAGYWFSYFYFSSASPSSATRQKIPG
jgi:hypothetical protein